TLGSSRESSTVSITIELEWRITLRTALTPFGSRTWSEVTLNIFPRKDTLLERTLALGDNMTVHYNATGANNSQRYSSSFAASSNRFWRPIHLTHECWHRTPIARRCRASLSW